MRENPSKIEVVDSKVSLPQGEIAVRQWLPCEVETDETPILMFHDSLGCIDLWREFPAMLAALCHRPVFAYDRLGFGRSAVRTDPLSVNFIVEEAQVFVPQLCDKLGLQSFIGFGHSVGGGMAANCAARLGNRCRALITEAAQAFVEQRTLDGILQAKALFEQPGQLDKLAKYHGERASWVLNAWTQTWLSSQFADWTLQDILPDITCPTLVIHGSEDEYGCVEQPEMIAAGVSGRVQMEVLADIRHVPHREAEGRVLELVCGFVKSL